MEKEWDCMMKSTSTIRCVILLEDSVIACNRLITFILGKLFSIFDSSIKTEDSFLFSQKTGSISFCKLPLDVELEIGGGQVPLGS